MFTKTLDSKGTYTDGDGNTLVNIMDGIFSSQYDTGSVHAIFKATKKCEMRPDYIAECMYGDEAYTEMVVKSSMIENPFAIEEGDILYSMRIDNIYHLVKPEIVNPDSSASVYDLVKKYHKYIDKTKIPDTPGSEKNPLSSASPEQEAPMEANISRTGATGISIVNGRIYFGTDSVPDTGESGYTAGGNISVTDGKLTFDLDDDVTEVIPNSGKETSTIVEDDGRVRFANLDGTEIEPGLIAPVKSAGVDCAKTGVSLGKFIAAGINNCRQS